MTDEINQPEVAVETPVAETPPTVDDTMLETLKEIRAREPNRADDGKFQPKAGAETATPKVEVPGSPQAAAPEPAALPAIEAPPSLPDDVKKVWTELPRAAQEAWARREGESHKKITADGERLKSLERYEQSLADARDFLKQHNVPEHEYVRRLVDADKKLRTQPYEAINWIAQTYGIDLGRLLQNPGSQPDPNSALTRKISELESRLAEREKADEDARLGDATQRIEAFKKDRPHFDDAVDLMDKLIRSGAAKGLEDAYDMAINASPDIRAKRDAKAKEEADKKAADEAKAKQAQDAKIAPFARRPGSAPAQAAKKGNWEDTMKDVHAEIRARG